MDKEFPIYIDGKWCKTDTPLEVRAPYDRSLVGNTYRAGEVEIENAILSSEKAFEQTRHMPAYEKSEKLLKIVEGIREQQEMFASILSAESGKAIKTSRSEVQRALLTFTDAAEECKRLRGEHMPLDFEPASKKRWAIIRRFPIGPILGISPFNFPLNLVAHKVAPALASGNPIILKPASQTPLTALLLARVIDDCGWPEGSFNVLPMDSKLAHYLIEDDRLKMLTFTGSPVVGWALKNKAGHKRVTLELGGNAGVIVHHDADLEFAATRCSFGAFTQSGQNCISVQRIYLHENIYDKFLDLFLNKVKALKTGDPADDDTDVGPMIHPDEITRVITWLDEAVKQGAEILTGGSVEGSLFFPTVVANVKSDMKISCDEIFAPLVVLYKYSDIGNAIEQVNDSRYGLQAGIITNDAKIIFQAYDSLEVGGLIAGDVPTYRIDPMPYGGSKESGMGREGVRFAMEEMMEMKLLVMNI